MTPSEASSQLASVTVVLTLQASGAATVRSMVNCVPQVVVMSAVYTPGAKSKIHESVEVYPFGPDQVQSKSDPPSFT